MPDKKDKERDKSRLNRKGATAPIAMALMIFVAIIAAAAVIIGGFAYGSQHNWFGNAQSLTGSAQLANPGTNLNQQAAGVCDGTLSATQTPVYTITDADRNTALTTTTTVYANAAQGVLLSGSNTAPGSSYSVLFQNTTYLGDLEKFTASCTTPTPMVFGKMEKLDASLALKVYNSDGRTANSIAANQTIGAGSQATIEFDITPSALYTHIGGPSNQPNGGQFAIFLNASNVTNWDTSKFAATLDPMFKGGCQQYTGVSPSFLTGAYVGGFSCTGDFNGTTTQVLKNYVSIGGSANYGAGQISICVVPYDYYKNTAPNSFGPQNVPLVGPVKNDGSQIDAPQCTVVFVA